MRKKSMDIQRSFGSSFWVPDRGASYPMQLVGTEHKGLLCPLAGEECEISHFLSDIEIS